MPFKIIRNDITKVKADAIVNTANPHPTYAAGTDAAIYKAAGAGLLLAERKKIGKMERGQAAVTPAFALPAKYIIHTVGPAWVDGKHGEFDVLSACYENCLVKASELHCESIAFPLIATGVYSFPKDRALQIAVSVISRFLLSHDMQVILVVFDQHSFELSGKLFQNVDDFIDENYVARQRKEEYLYPDQPFDSEPDMAEIMERSRRLRLAESRRILSDSEQPSSEMMESITCPESEPLYSLKMSAPMSISPEMSLDDALGNVGETFQQRLLHLIDERGLSDVDVYKRANMDRKLFSKIRCNENYKPKKKTALALAIALKLNLDDTVDLLKRAELALSPSNKSDLIIEYFISRQEYDIYSINLALFEHGQPILGE
ncbi:MAG: macro domain-containing protein [Lachnospiraceae bacterium]|nr:macro domain-containing protein [Lachnospiraceae bacterium]